jgi:hypothetical protein
MTKLFGTGKKPNLGYQTVEIKLYQGTVFGWDDQVLHIGVNFTSGLRMLHHFIADPHPDSDPDPH